jgi:hypothetical protein
MFIGFLWYNNGVGRVFHHPADSYQNTIHVGGEQQMTEREFTIEELANEEWRDVLGFEGVYSISSLGRVRRDLGSKGATAGKVRKPGNHKQGYLQVNLMRDGKYKSFKVHQLVANAFLGQCPEGMEVNHIRQPKTNNRVPNLEYVTHKGNMEHAHRNGLMNPPRGNRSGRHTKPERTARGDRHGRRLLPDNYPHGDNHVWTKLKFKNIPLVLKLREEGLTQEQIGKIVGLRRSQVGNILRGEARQKS